MSASSSDKNSKATHWTWVVQFLEGISSGHERADLLLQKVVSEGKGVATGGPLQPVSRTQMQRLIETGQVKANGVLIQASSRLKLGTQVEIQFPLPTSTELIPEDRELEILFEDEHLLVLNKPPGLVVHPSPSKMDGTLVHALLHHIRDLSGIGGVLRPGVVHRIDKDTSGALVITKTDAAHRQLADAFSKHSIERVYWAICFGSPPHANFDTYTKIESLIGRNPSDRKKMSMKVKEGRKAITLYRKIKEFSAKKSSPFASWIEVTLETGRTHQVRVHLTGVGHSLLGDPTYGAASETQAKWLALPNRVKEIVKLLPGQALHARILGFKHPITGESLRFEAEPPLQYQLLLDLLLKDYL